MKILKKYKRSTKLICRKCGFPVTATNNSNCMVSGKCSACLEGIRLGRMDWAKWESKMKKLTKGCWTNPLTKQTA